MMKTTLLIVFFGLFLSGFSQKKPLIERYDEVVKAGIKALDDAMKAPDGELFLLKEENGITGMYDFDVTLHEKGEVATVLVNSRDGGTIGMQNLLKDFVREMKFKFKMPRGRDYKFNYVFNFNQ